MRLQANDWALVLAAGTGTRLKSLTTNASGEAVPKQFCSLDGGPSLLRRTIERAHRVVPTGRVAVIVAAEHRHHWERPLLDLAPQNIIVQPINRGTGIGILLPMLEILKRDTHARVAILPSDHYIAEEAILSRAIRAALAAAGDDITLLGFEPDSCDPEFGYVISGDTDSQGRRGITCFVEKPSPQLATDLIAAGALWNSFVMVAPARAIVEVIAARYPRIVEALRYAVDTAVSARELNEVYAGLPSIDFSKDVVTPAIDRMKVLPVPACGWTDLGTPQRVGECLARLLHTGERRSPRSGPRPGAAVLDLADALQRRQPRYAAAPSSNQATRLVGELV